MKSYIFYLGLLSCLVFSGCSSKTALETDRVIDTKQIDATDSRVLVVYGNIQFKDKVLVVRKIVDDSGNLPRASVTLQNVSHETYIIEYQFQWLEANGMPIMQTPAWHRITLAPNAVKPLINVAKMPEAHNVEFTVRFPMSKLYKPMTEKEKAKKTKK